MVSAVRENPYFNAWAISTAYFNTRKHVDYHVVAVPAGIPKCSPYHYE